MSLLEEMFDGSQEQLNERPYSRTQSAIDSVKGKAKGMFGSGQVEQGAQQTGQQANQLWNDFKRYVGRKYGSHPQAVSYADVAAFFKGNNLDTKFLGNNERRSFTPKDVGNAILSAARELGDDYTNQDDEQEEQGQPPAGDNSQGQPQGGSQGGQPPAGGSGSSDLSGKLSSLSASDRAKLLRLIS
ncbi:Hsp70 heat shock protein [Serratia phage BF]|uniref:Structural protein n=3 Tax=Eneladusvirus BF TaxID=2560751 RepID=A0A1S6UAK9_9CAUD|nr:Hsp70 heat shock protein [Serratia phage BF]AQW88732.1 structural protein [Serratia phage BF]QOI71144.1 putative structural protein [Erwinia phage pEa_SNUABM_12]QOI71688.1 putative structural protein [Erwinia phage pEa_SNUABM_47]QXO11901.1 hypothetical protein pEaSNUABM44_00205 [Erwinia phage pEa_SNUABM_44]